MGLEDNDVNVNDGTERENLRRRERAVRMGE